MVYSYKRSINFIIEIIFMKINYNLMERLIDITLFGKTEQKRNVP